MTSTPDPSPLAAPGSPPGWGSGMVTGRELPATTPPATDDLRPAGDPQADRRRLMLFGGVAGAVLVIGVVVVLGLGLTGGLGDPGWDRPEPVVDVRPPLAQACPAPSAPVPDEPSQPAPSQPAPSGSAGAPSGERTVDRRAGISYKEYGAPWEPWRTVWRAGTLNVPYTVGQHFVTERYPGGTYHASILSAAVPVADNDAIDLDLECVGRQVAADVRAEYYPQPNRQEPIRDERTVLGGRPAWVTVFRLHFDRPGLTAKDELAAVATIDVGRPECAILYVSIPGTHRQFDHVVEEVLASVTVP